MTKPTAISCSHAQRASGRRCMASIGMCRGMEAIRHSSECSTSIFTVRNCADTLNAAGCLTLVSFGWRAARLVVSGFQASPAINWVSQGMTQRMTAREVAKRFDVDPSTVRKWRIDGCPTISPGGKGRGNAALFDLAQVVAWRGGASGPAGLTVDEVMQKVATVLLDCLEQDHVDVCAGVSVEDAAAVLLGVFEGCCKGFNRRFAFDAQPEPIRALMRIL